MEELLSPIAAFLHSVLPGWMTLPHLTFVLPHTVYWLGLLLFPPIAIFLCKRAKATKKMQVSLGIAYLLWLWGGFVGLHRFYLKSWILGVVYTVLFLVVLVGNDISRDARNVSSDYNNKLKVAEFQVTRAQKDVDRGRDGAEAKLETASKARDGVRENAKAAELALSQWRSLVGAVFAIVAAFLLVDALLLPGLARRCAERIPAISDDENIQIMERGAKEDERQAITNPTIRAIERTSGWTGEFVAYWSVIAVFVYYYEVIARYVFNSPTNWAHESMFLMFGMQYLLSGAYALREGAHVRVDVIYALFSVRTRAMIDIATSLLFFIFAATLLATGYVFARDAVEVMEVSFTEWAIEYWPVKITMFIGAALLLAQGLAKLMRDVLFLTRAKGSAHGA